MMRSAKSIQSLTSQQSLQKPSTNGSQQVDHPKINNASNVQIASNSTPTSPICRCRVMYLGSSVPHITKDGLQGIQEPLRELYPDEVSLASGNAGIDSWLSVWSNGILIENVDKNGREVKRFFKIDALHYCAAVKFVSIPYNQQQQQQMTSYNSNLSNGNSSQLPKFLPLDSPHARQANSSPPIFASILRRTTGVKVLECHAFICKREAAANALVRCCFHAYADTIYAKQIGADVNGISNDINNNVNNRLLESQQAQAQAEMKLHDQVSMRKVDQHPPPMATRRSKSIANLNDAEQTRMEAWRSSDSSSYSNNKANYDDPQFARSQQDHNSMIRRKNVNEHYALYCDNTDSRLDKQQLQVHNDNLRKQNKFSKSMHHLNQSGQIYGMNYNQVIKAEQANDLDGYGSGQSTSTSCVNIPNSNNRWAQQESSRQMQQVPHPPFFNPYSGRVPSYPPQNMMESANNGGTLRSIKSMAANSIASTLLRSKKHAKAMSMAQLNQDKITSFHQPHSNASTMVGPILLPPVPPMFLPNLPPRILNGSQTMKVPSRNMVPAMNPPMNFEAMTPKEMKKLLKKSAKYGIDPHKFGDNGLPILPLRKPAAPIQQSCHIPQTSGVHPMPGPPMFQDFYSSEIMDMAPPPHGFSRGGTMIPEQIDQHQMKPILVKPNPEFLKSKAGKKWLKQQKEFKKLLPPHLDGLPIIFGPPPVEALEQAGIPANGVPSPRFIPSQPPIPVMDSSGYYNPQPFYGQTGRASATSTLLRYSPHSQMMHENSINIHHNDPEYIQRNHPMYNSSMVGHPPIIPNQVGYIGGGDDSSVIFGHPDCSLEMHGRPSFVDNGHAHHKRNHMVEQSVISLGDENDYDDDEVDERQNNYYSSASHSGEVISNSRRSKGQQQQQAGGLKSKNREHGSEQHIMENYQDKEIYNQQDYDQAIQPGDDQGSYSSGIYKKGHINERAFSYSIRQEHKSGAGADPNCDYIMRNEIMAENGDGRGMTPHDNQQSQGNIYQHNQNEEYYHNDSQTMPVNELTARLENQLNMKSFANSRVKSQI